MRRLPSTILLLVAVAASACFLGAIDSLSSSSSASSVTHQNSNSNSNSNNNAITDGMRNAATAEAERLFRYYETRKKENPATGGETTTAAAATIQPRPQRQRQDSPVVWQSSEEASAYVRDHIDTILFDCDGVLYRTTSLCPGASECIRGLMFHQNKEQNKRVLFVTNNAGVNRKELREKLSELLEIDSLATDQMISSSYASAKYLERKLLAPDKENGNRKRKRNRVHVIGSSGLCEELVAAGFDVTGGPNSIGSNRRDDKNEKEHEQEPGSMSRDELGAYDFDSRLHPIDALVVGHDTDLNFRKLCIADNLLLRNPQALFVATNMDSFDVVDGNSNSTTNSNNGNNGGGDDDGDGGDDDEKGQIRHILGNGATVVALEYSSKRKAINVGKPSRELFDLMRGDSERIEDDNDNTNDNDTTREQQHRSPPPFGDPSRCLFVGDRLDTDIRFGKDNGMKSLLVLTGVTTAETLEELGDGTEDEPLPDFIVPYVGMLV